MLYYLQPCHPPWKQKAAMQKIPYLAGVGSLMYASMATHPIEEFTLGIDPKSLHAMVLMQTVYNAVVRHSGGFLKHMAISDTERVKITGA